MNAAQYHAPCFLPSFQVALGAHQVRRYPTTQQGSKLGTVGNPGISYLDLLILIPGSRAISICLFYAIHITKA